MSPFQVTTTRDYGYRASNSIAGTRLDMPIRDIALNIQVFTKDLTDDLVISDQTNLERYNAAVVNGGADVQSDNVIQQAYNAFLFRGFVQNWGLRDGIREYDPVDSQGLARVEVVKGPAAALYGLSYAGGVMNSITKQVDMGKNFGSVRLMTSDEGGFRYTVDANYAGRAGDGRFGVRFNGAYATTQDKRDHSDGRTEFSQVNLQWQPLRDTTIALLVESSWRQKPNDLGYYTRAGGSVAATAAQELGVGVVIPLQADHPNIPWTWNWADAGSNDRSLETHMVRGTVTQKISDDFYVTGYFQANRHQNIDSNGWDDNNNSQNAAGWDVAGWSQFGCVPTGWLNPGTPNEVIRKVFHWRDWSNSIHAYGGNAVYKFDAASIKNTITAGGAYWAENFWSNKWLEPDDGAATVVFDLPVRAGISTQVPVGGAPTSLTHNLGEGNRERNKNNYYYVNWQLAAFDNRLRLSAAVNHTHIRNIAWANISATAYNAPGVDVSKDSPMFGAMFDITPQVSIFAVHSTSLFPTTDKNDFNVPLPPEIGKSNEVGFKFDLLNSAINGTISYYKINKTGGGVRDPSAINQNKVLWDTYTTAQRALYFPGLTRDQLLDRNGGLGDLVPAELESKGLEADLAIQPTKNLQVVLSYANNSEESTNGVTQGDTVSGHIRQQYSVLVKYIFTEGGAKGLSLGLGLQGAGQALQDYQIGSNGVRIARYNPSTFYAEFFAGYRFKAFGCNQVIQFNAKNLTRVDDVIGWKPSGAAGVVATQRYLVPTYAKFALTYGLDF